MLNKIIPKIQIRLISKSKLKLTRKNFCKFSMQSPLESTIFNNISTQQMDQQQVEEQKKSEFEKIILPELMELPEDIFFRQLNTNSQLLGDFQQFMSFLVHGTTQIQKGMLLKRINYIYEQINQLQKDQDSLHEEKIQFFKQKLQKQMENFLKRCYAPRVITLKSQNIDFSHPKVFNIIQTYCNAEEIEFQNEDLYDELKFEKIRQQAQENQKVQKTNQKMKNNDQSEFTFINDISLKQFQTQKKKKKKTEIQGVLLDQINNFQQDNELIILNKENKPKETNWVFIQGLPYTFDENKMKEDLRAALLQNGPIQSIRFYQYCDYQSQVISTLKETKDDVNKKYFWKQHEKFKQQQKEQHNNQEDSINKSQALNIQQKLKLKVKDNKFAKLNKSFALVQFINQEDKKKFMSQSLRLFGLFLGKQCYLLEDADRKYYLQITNIQFGQSLSKLIQRINKIISKFDIQKYDLDIDNQTKIIVNGQIILGFENFEDSLKIQEKLDNLKIDGQMIKVRHLYGNLVYKNNSLQEKIIFNQKFVIESKLDQIKKQKQVLQKSKN